MLNILGHKENANPSTLSSTLLWSEWLSSITQTKTNAEEDMRKNEYLYSLGGNIN
jgi:hypothetical protein